MKKPTLRIWYIAFAQTTQSHHFLKIDGWNAAKFNS